MLYMYTGPLLDVIYDYCLGHSSPPLTTTRGPKGCLPDGKGLVLPKLLHILTALMFHLRLYMQSVGLTLEVQVCGTNTFRLATGPPMTSVYHSVGGVCAGTGGTGSWNLGPLGE